MKGALLKISGIYTLMCDDKMIASDDVDFQSDYQIGKLSLKNCEAIENGYDLHELVKSKYPNAYNEDFEYDSEAEMLRDEYKSRGFYEGAKAILEILGDKKFSERDMIKFAEYCLDNSDCFSTPKNNLFEEWESLQQTEWEVEVEMHEVWKYGDFEYKEPFIEPKLDAKGCLILKKIND